MMPILLGIDGLGYGGFMECETPTFLSLVNSMERGVVENHAPQLENTAWSTILMVSGPDPSSSALMKLTKAIAVNVPITDPTYGIYSIHLNESTMPEDEVNQVINAVINASRERPVIASITAIERFLHKKPSMKCDIYSIIDGGIRRLLSSSDLGHIIIFSPFGEPQSEKEGDHYDYGVYLSTMPRPRHHDTVKLDEIGSLFLDMVEQANAYQ